MMRTMTRIAGTLASLAVACGILTNLGGCNTVKGAGTDIQNVGQAGQNAIDNAEKK